jgi:CBS-domain-containing membrane protein
MPCTIPNTICLRRCGFTDESDWIGSDFQTLAPHDPLARATDRILAGSQQDFPVLDDGQVVGILTRRDLIVGLTQRGQDTSVGDSIQRDFETVDASEMLETAFRRLQSCQCHTVPVLQRGELVGLVTMETSASLWPSRLRTRTSLQPGGRLSMSEAIEGGPFLDAIQRLDKAAQYADIDDESLERLRHPETMLQVSIPVRMNDGSLRIFRAYGWGTMMRGGLVLDRGRSARAA